MKLGKALIEGNGRAHHEWKLIWVYDDAATGEYTYITPAQVLRFNGWAALSQHLEMTGTPASAWDWKAMRG